MQIVVVCRDTAPGVRHSLQVAADRDIHIDLIDVEDATRGACLRAGFAASRGSQIIAMNADEWFASSMARELDQLIPSGLIAQTSGVMYSRSLFDACLSHDKTYRTVGFMACALSRAQRVSGCGEACFHAVAPKLTDAFDPTMFARLSDDVRALDEFTGSLEEAGDGGQLKVASQKFYFAGLVACIENLCLSPHGVSSIERSARMRDMLEAPRTRQMAAALKDDHRGLGLLFGPIASARPTRCVMCTHLAAFLNRTGAKTA